MVVETTDGGTTWVARKIAQSSDWDNPDLALAMQAPIFYDIGFANEQIGWVSGEVGRLLKGSPSSPPVSRTFRGTSGIPAGRVRSALARTGIPPAGKPSTTSIEAGPVTR